MNNIIKLLTSLGIDSVANATIAVDFDYTLCHSNYPECGEPNQRVVDLVKELKSQGVTLILWTCREGIPLGRAIIWCKEQGLTFDHINSNSPSRNAIYGGDCRKVGADIYIDDRAFPPSYFEKEEII